MKLPSEMQPIVAKMLSEENLKGMGSGTARAEELGRATSQEAALKSVALMMRKPAGEKLSTWNRMVSLSCKNGRGPEPKLELRVQLMR